LLSCTFTIKDRAE